MSKAKDFTKRSERLNAIYKRIERESRGSLLQYLGNVVIDARPQPMSWGLLWEPWQGMVIEPIIPAMEQMAGLRSDYDGPRKFWYTLPRGHDKTGLIARLANWVAGFSRHQTSGSTSAGSRDQAKLLLKSARAEINLNPWLAHLLEPYRNEIRGPGGLLEVLSSEAGTSSGRKDDLIVCDELTFWPDKKLFDILWSGSEKRPDSVFIIITNAGIINSWQDEVRNLAKADPKNWHVYETPVKTQLASWMTPEAVQSLKAILTRGISRRVLDNEWVEATEIPLLELALHILPNVEDCLWSDPFNTDLAMTFGKTPELYAGFDIGRSQDKSCISIIEKKDGIDRLRSLIVLSKVAFDEQMRIAEQVAQMKGLVAMRIDKGTIGMQIAENLENKYPNLCEGVSMSAGWQGANAVKIKTKLELRKLRLPQDKILHADMQLVEEVVNNSSGVPVIVTKHDKLIGHADRFWSIALAVSSMPSDFVLPTMPALPPRSFRSKHS